MTTNITIGYPQAGEVYTVSPAASATYPVINLGYGARRTRYQAGSATTSHTISYNGSTFASDFLYLARAKLLTGESAATAISLDRSSDGASWTTVKSAAPIGTLTGPRAEDYFSTFTATSTYTYWRLVVSNAGNITPTFSKLMFGTRIDFGRDPHWGRAVKRSKEVNGQREPFYTYQLNWNGVTDAKLKDFDTRINKIRDVQTVVLCATAYVDYLNGNSAIHCRITEVEVKPLNYNNNALTITFEEEI